MSSRGNAGKHRNVEIMAIHRPEIFRSVDSVSVGLYSGATNLTAAGGNLMVSPLSIMYAAVLVYIGAKGHTKDNLYSSLSLDKSFSNADADIAAAFGDALKQLKPKRDNSSAAESGSSGRAEKFELALANGVFVRNDVELNQNYLASVTQQLNAAIQKVNFAKQSEAARADINKWVTEQTGGKIKDLIPGGVLDGDTISVLANAIYFKASWLKQFDPFFTKNGSFSLLNGKSAAVPFMTSNVGEWKYYEDKSAGLEYLEFPYLGSDASLLIYLPLKKDGLRSAEKVFNFSSFHYDSLATERIINLTLPKFRVESSIDLKKLLQKIGVEDIFDKKIADLSGMVSAPGVYISSAFHKTFIDVDEKGTEAAAASAAVSKSRTATRFKSNLPRIDFVADHPFLFAIRHNPTKLIIFVGRVEKF